ncbi:hypothetical protein [Nocardiopsis sp. NRRL B-16309]|uniref:hypothetical protein n=1 Tax=Nocardiopsis sp. NRRL B-16309 TaxID=1519494 RepID=UPI0006AF85E1|nr:hypothetical protein [Nocardiopsis sp. NRRL B-16309]KOX13692.1 hypothetical protein ADL05_18600 [Nocardiopsis sp. NRRL B-16309]
MAEETGSEPDEAPGVVIVGAHGGSGASTLAAMLPDPVYDVGPLMAPDGRVRGVHAHGRPIVLTSRNTVRSAEAASAAIKGLREQGLEAACLVVVADGVGSEPREARVRFRMLEGHTTVHRMSYLSLLRTSESVPPLEELPRKSQSEISQVLEIVQKA